MCALKRAFRWGCRCKGQLLGVVRGDVRAISGERTALNYLQRMSGIATYTNKVAKLKQRHDAG
ncbi:MAG: hypothetical protein ACLT98_17475 [Eggerthellaceae bacterium]